MKTQNQPTSRRHRSRPQENFPLSAIETIADAPERLRRFLNRKGGGTVFLFFLVLMLMPAAALGLPNASYGFGFSLFILIRVLSGKFASNSFLLNLLAALTPILAYWLPLRRVELKVDTLKKDLAEEPLKDTP